MTSTQKDSVDSQEGPWSSSELLMAGMEKESEYTELGTPGVRRYEARYWWLYLLHILIFTSYSVAFLTATTFWKSQDSINDLVYSPASNALTYHKVAYDGGEDLDTPYRGRPRPELDKAWHDLLHNNNIRLTKDELQKMNRTAIELDDGSGYYGQMGAYHHLHCLKFLRQVLYPDYYLTGSVDIDSHIDHCVDDIRQALMCHADTSVITFDWRTDTRNPWPDFATDRTCANWQALDDWASKRSFSVFDQKSLVHPEFGLAFPMVGGKIELKQGPGMHIVWPADRQ